MSKITRLILVLAGIFTAIAISTPLLLKYFNRDFNVEQLGTMGDWMGGSMTPTFSLVGSLLILAAFLAQREELELVKKEYELNRKEMELSRKEIEEQNDTLMRQRFESSFFQLLSILRGVVDSFEYHGSSGGAVLRGRHGLMYSYNVMKNDFTKEYNKAASQAQTGDNIEFIAIRNCYMNHYKSNMQFLGHYFRNLYHTVQLIDKSEFLSAADKKDYIRILRAQLSAYEMSWLLYNAINEHGYPSFYKLIIKYDLLQNIDESTLFRKPHLDFFYKFGMAI